MATDKNTGAQLVEVADYADRKSYQVYAPDSRGALIGVITKLENSDWRWESKHRSLYDGSTVRSTSRTRADAVRRVVQMDSERPAAIALKAAQDEERVAEAKRRLAGFANDVLKSVVALDNKAEIAATIRGFENTLQAIAVLVDRR